ncbi:recombination regulator RecX [Agrilactobacillus fermenti]|uniref:recombination regulator RecX n=1 Tax=Agrilactobacillus fermenti TaxID=2586909 RepID=UPI001E300468|nr:recombination regulator RecX [Agrilactobacillus fermenti]MCD2255186.1 recombination regulator RecX [Agrilactobacillus fermenti]
MKITKIEAQKRHKDRYNIYLDEAYAFPVAESVLIQFTLMKGLELTEAQVEQIKKADDQAKAYGKALNYLSYQLRSEKEMRDYLYDQDYTTATVKAIIAKLKDLNYLDDADFAASYVRTEARLTKKGPRSISQKLFQKGIDRNLIEDKLVSDYPVEQQVDNAVELLQKLIRTTHNKSFIQLKQKIKQNLMQKGFTTEVIDQALQAVALDRDDDAEWDALVNAGEKLWRRQATKPQGIQKIKQGLYRKGFKLDMIQRFLDEKQAADEG